MAGIELKNKETQLENLKIEQDILKTELFPKKEEEPEPEPEQPKGFFARLFGRR